MVEPRTWQTDRTRYMNGHACNWRRLLGFHAFGTGISPSTISTPLATGVYTHQALELLLRSNAVTKDEVAAAIKPALDTYRSYAQPAAPDFPIDEQVALVEGMTHAYARVVLPWVREQFDIIMIEEETPLTTPLVEWMTRSDFVTIHRATGTVAVHDFKTSGSWSEKRDVGEYQDSVQMMMNASAVAQKLGKTVSYYYIHALLKGNDYAQSPLIYPYCRPGNPPIQKADLQASYKYTKPDGTPGYLGRTYSRIRVWQAMPVADWVWQMHEADCAKQIVLIGPYDVQPNKLARFRRGMVENEMLWKERLANLDWARWREPQFQAELDTTFPRTYQCYTYGTRCSFYRLCHQHAGWEDPIGTGDYETRTPHHTTEEI